MSKSKLDTYLKIYQEEHIKNGMSYSKIREKYNIPRGTWDYYVRQLSGNSCDLRKHRVNDTFFNNIDSEIKSYLLGFLYGDGYITKDGRIGIMLQEEDVEILDLIKNFIAPKSTIRRTNCQIGVKFSRKNQVSIRFRSKEIYDRLLDLGFTTNKTFTECNILEYIPENYKIDFIRGFCDADGSFTFSKQNGNWYKTSFTICKGSKRILEDIFQFFKQKNILIGEVKSEKRYKEWILSFKYL